MAALSPTFVDIRDSYPSEFDALILARRTSQSAHDHAVRERILDEATELFDQQGYMSTSVRQIAAQLGSTSASLYNHFASKEDVLYGIVVRARVALFEHECSKFPMDVRPKAVVVGLLRHSIRVCCRSPSRDICQHPRQSPICLPTDGRRSIEYADIASTGSPTSSPGAAAATSPSRVGHTLLVTDHATREYRFACAVDPSGN